MTSAFCRHDPHCNVSGANRKHRMNDISCKKRSQIIAVSKIFFLLLVSYLYLYAYINYTRKRNKIKGHFSFFRINNDILILSSMFPNKQPEKRIHAQPCLFLRHFAPQDAPITSSTGKMIRSAEVRFPVSCSVILRRSISTAFRPISYCG